MLIIPVIDLSHGIVVHAICGKRKSYRPITSTISDNCKPESILSAFLKLYPFKVIYIADLDAIQGNGNQSKLINNFALKYKECEFWVDAGIHQILTRKSNKTNKNIKFILGSENNIALHDYEKTIKSNPDILLSLDFNEKGLINNSYLLNSSSIWPKKVIVMMLHRVGSNNGIDTKHLKNIISLNKNSEIYLAGGIKNSNDIKSLNSKNIKGCLIATALHQQKITKKELNLFFNG
jgi:phosphoribosylformimino-5-aminoimidazole carboxamide ribotide isomerase|tara:strand:+ start:2108 stop:2812 length:705 start_codon:yes stop_codon:yes gene_type:complete